MKPLSKQPPKKRVGRPRKKGSLDVVLPVKAIKPKLEGNVLTLEQKRSKRNLERMEAMSEAVNEASQLQNFPKMILGIDAYEWQGKVLSALNVRESRVALKAANGSGKTSLVAASAVLWHMVRFPESLVVTTAGVWRQVEGQLWPTLKKYISGLGGGWRATSNELSYSNGSRVLVMSSPGASAGAFYESFTKQRKSWDNFTVTAFECPHIKQSWIDEQKEIYGEDSPLVRSMIYGEFYDDSGEGLVLPLKTLEGCLQNPPKHETGGRVAFVDFAAGGDECVFALRDGNKVVEMVCWRDRDTNRTIGEIISLMERFGLSGDEVYADEGGLGLPLCDALMASGHDIHRVNFGAKPFDSRYANRSAEMWHSAARTIQRKEVILPDDPTLHQQMVTRRADVTRTGKLGVEAKDRADAVLGCISCGGGIGGTWEQFKENGAVSLEEVFEMARADYEADVLPSGMSVGY